MKRLLSLLTPACLAVSLLPSAAAETSTIDRFAWPAEANFPIGANLTYFDWQALANDDPVEEALVSLRGLNEDVAGESGWVTRQGERLFLANGEPVRFWTVNTESTSTETELHALGAQLSRRGVNMARVHGPRKSLVQADGNSIFDVNMDLVDQMQRHVSIMKQYGIYTWISNTYFVVGTRIRAQWDIPGYTAEWLAQNPNFQEPYGLVFVDPTFREAFLQWIEVLMTTPNPYDPDNKPLAEDTAVGILETLNEDNLFFNTFEPTRRWPLEQQDNINKMFFDWIVEKYGEPGEDPQAAATRVFSDIWQQRQFPQDNIAGGRILVGNISTMRGGEHLRSSDQVQFMAELQRSLYEDAEERMRALGYGGTMTASNWRTIQDDIYHDLEFWTYLPAGVIDVHNFFSPATSEGGLDYRVEPGSRHLSFPVVANPRRSPVTFKRVANHPLTVSESNWVNYTPFSAEGPLVVAAYGAMADLDSWAWFAQTRQVWQNVIGKWSSATPMISGQFPATSLLYRRGDIAEAPVVVREGRTAQSMFDRTRSRIMPRFGFDVTRDNPDDFGEDPVTGARVLDPLTMLVGKVEVDYSTDEDGIHPAVFRLVDNEAQRVTSITGEIVTDWKHGLTLVDAPRAQGVSGYLRDAGLIELSNVAVESDNYFGSFLAISLDDLPIAQSSEVLLQAGTNNRPRGFEFQNVEMTWNNNTYAGMQVTDQGGGGLEVVHIDTTVTLRNVADRIQQVIALDHDLRERQLLEWHAAGDDVTIDLPRDTLYTLVRLAEPETYLPFIASRSLPEGFADESYDSQLRLYGNSEGITWSATNVPAGIEISPTGQVSGTPLAGGAHALEVTATDNDGNAHSVDVHWTIHPLPPLAMPILGALSSNYKMSPWGWVFDGHHPWIWFHTIEGYVWVHPDFDQEAGGFLWVNQDDGYYIWASTLLDGWVYAYDGPNPGWQYWWF